MEKISLSKDLEINERWAKKMVIAVWIVEWRVIIILCKRFFLKGQSVLGTG